MAKFAKKSVLNKKREVALCDASFIFRSCVSQSACIQLEMADPYETGCSASGNGNWLSLHDITPVPFDVPRRRQWFRQFGVPRACDLFRLARN
jgi:hypothetical protein